MHPLLFGAETNGLYANISTYLLHSN